jgi:xylulokinase
MSESLLLAHDIGTSATKTSVVSSCGEIIDTESRPQKTHSPKPGWAEQLPADWWQGVCQNTRVLIDRNPDDASRIAAIGVSGHMLGMVLLDKSGEVIRPAFIHADTRSISQFKSVDAMIGKQKVYETTGNILDSRSPLCKLLWVRENEAENYGKIHRCIQSKDYITGKMIGAYETTDFSDASHAQFLDIRKMMYASDMLQALDINPDILPPLKASTEIAGRLCDEAAHCMGLPAGIPISVGGGDGACASVGAGAVKPGNTYCCFGTTAWISMTAPSPHFDPRQRIFNLVSLDGNNYAILGTVQCAGRSIDWIRHVLQEDDFSRMDAEVEAVAAGSDDLIFLPYLEGERAPIYDANARGVFYGLTPAHGRSHLLRATVEGVCLGLGSVVKILREIQPVESFRIIGGGARSEVLRSILASACNAPIKTLSVAAADATALGAALAAGVGVGVFDNLEEATSSIRETDTTEANPTHAEVYARYTLRQVEIYECLKPLFEKQSRESTG